jgi:hypothetical protein
MRTFADCLSQNLSFLQLTSCNSCPPSAYLPQRNGCPSSCLPPAMVVLPAAYLPQRLSLLLPISRNCPFCCHLPQGLYFLPSTSRNGFPSCCLPPATAVPPAAYLPQRLSLLLPTYRNVCPSCCPTSHLPRSSCLYATAHYFHLPVKTFHLELFILCNWTV